MVPYRLLGGSPWPEHGRRFGMEQGRQHLSDAIKDDGGRCYNRLPTNRSNRIEVADQINARMSAGQPGPFWCQRHAGKYPHIPQTRPANPFETAQGFTIRPLRVTDERARSQNSISSVRERKCQCRLKSPHLCRSKIPQVSRGSGINRLRDRGARLLNRLTSLRPGIDHKPRIG